MICFAELCFFLLCLTMERQTPTQLDSSSRLSFFLSIHRLSLVIFWWNLSLMSMSVFIWTTACLSYSYHTPDFLWRTYEFTHIYFCCPMLCDRIVWYISFQSLIVVIVMESQMVFFAWFTEYPVRFLFFSAFSTCQIYDTSLQEEGSLVCTRGWTDWQVRCEYGLD